MPNYEAFISELVLAEIGAAPNGELRDGLARLVSPLQVLSVSLDAEALSREYLKYLSIPEEALHLAVASVEGINYFVIGVKRNDTLRGKRGYAKEGFKGFPTAPYDE